MTIKLSDYPTHGSIVVDRIPISLMIRVINSVFNLRNSKTKFWNILELGSSGIPELYNSGIIPEVRLKADLIRD